MIVVTQAPLYKVPVEHPQQAKVVPVVPVYIPYVQLLGGAAEATDGVHDAKLAEAEFKLQTKVGVAPVAVAVVWHQ